MEKKFEKLVKIFLLSSPFLDMLTAFCIQILKINITVGVIFRLIFLVVGLSYLIFINHSKNKKKFLIITGIISSYLVIFLSLVLVNKGSNAFFYEARNAIKSFYFPYLLIIFTAIFEAKLKVIPKKYFLYLGLVYFLGIFIPDILGVGFNSYEVTKTGSIGFFYTANEVGGIISLLMPFILMHLYQEKNMIKTMLALAIIVYTLLSMGTKGPLLAFIIIISFWVLYLIVNLIRKKEYKNLSYIALTLLISTSAIVIILPKTAFYKNIEVHLDFLEVDSVFDILKDEELLDHFVFSSRLKFMKNSFNNYQTSSIVEKLFGLGYIENYGEDDVNIKMIEMDYIDIFVRHGIIGFIIYMSVYIYFLITAIKRVMKSKVVIIKYTYLLSIFLSIILSLLTGHIIMAPAVSIIVVLLLTNTKLKEEVL